MRTIGLPDDLVGLVEVWLKDRCFYVSIDGNNSLLYDLLLGTVQGSVLGPVLYAIFISPLFDLEDLSAFADDNYTIKWHRDLEIAKSEIQASLNNIVSWLTSSGLKVNEAKTEICLFSRSNVEPVEISVSGQEVQSKTQINVLGIIFDSKLQWGPQIASALKKSSKALNAIRLIKRFFDPNELLQLITSNFYSVLYYNSEVWHLSTLHHSLKNQLLSHSAKAIKICTRSSDVWMLSFENLHEMAGRATPDQFQKYKLALQLYRTFNLQVPTQDWVNVNINFRNTSRQIHFHTHKSNRLKIGMNMLSNRFFYLNGKIELDWFNLSFNSFKVKCKKLFL